MKNIIRKFSVFATLLLVGISMMGLTNFLMPEYGKTLSMIVGFLGGLVVTIFEVSFYKNHFNKYKPTLLPYIILFIFILLSGITIEVGGFIAVSPGAYLTTLAITFKIYEFKTKNNWITWNELLDK